MSQPNDPRFVPPPTQSAFRQEVVPPYAGYAYHDPATRNQGGPVHGDQAGEYMAMERGRYDAWAYVVFAFIGQLGAIWAIALLPFFGFASVAGFDTDTQFPVAAGIAAVPAIAGAYFTFRDRWRCIEAFSSRYCSGLANLSMLYVPFIALIYANYRALLKIRGR